MVSTLRLIQSLGFSKRYRAEDGGRTSNCSHLRPISTQENFPRTENFPKISLLKVENFQFQNFFPTENLCRPITFYKIFFLWKIFPSGNEPFQQQAIDTAFCFVFTSRLELVLAFHFLADASCSNVRVLEVFQYFMSLDFSPVVIPVDRVPHLCETCYSSLPTSP